MFIVEGLALALALVAFFMAAAVENRFQSFARPIIEPPQKTQAPISVRVAAE